MSSIILSQPGVAHPSAIVGAKAFYWSNSPSGPPDIANLARRFASDVGVTKDGGNLVSAWVDQQASGNDLANPTGSTQPLWQTNQTGGLPAILFDGVDNFLSVGTGSISKPTTIYFLVNQVTWTDNDTWMNDNGGAYNFQVFQNIASPQVDFFPGNTGPTLTTFPVNTWGVVMFMANGTSSATRYNLNAANVGGNSGATALAGLMVGADVSGTSPANINVAEILIYQGAHDTATQNAAIRYLAQRGGVTV